MQAQIRVTKRAAAFTDNLFPISVSRGFRHCLAPLGDLLLALSLLFVMRKEAFKQWSWQIFVAEMVGERDSVFKATQILRIVTYLWYHEWAWSPGVYTLDKSHHSILACLCMYPILGVVFICLLKFLRWFYKMANGCNKKHHRDPQGPKRLFPYFTFHLK